MLYMYRYVYVYMHIYYPVLLYIISYYLIFPYIILYSPANPMKSYGVNRPLETYLPQLSNPWFPELSTTKITNPWSSPSDRLCPAPGQIRLLGDHC